MILKWSLISFLVVFSSFGLDGASVLEVDGETSSTDSSTETSPRVSPSLTSRGRKRLFQDMLGDTIDLETPDSESKQSEEQTSPASTADLSIFDASTDIRSCLKGTRVLPDHITGITFTPILGEYEKVAPASFSKAEPTLERRFWDSVFSEDHTEAIAIVKSGYYPPNSEFAFKRMSTIVSHPRVSAHTLLFLTTRVPTLFNNSYGPNNQNIFNVATQNVIDFMTDNCSYNRKLMRMVFLAYIQNPELSMKDSVFEKHPEDHRIVEWRIRTALHFNARPEVLRKVHLLPRNLAFFMRGTGETPLTQAIKAKNLLTLDFLLRRNDACQNIFFPNNSGEFPLHLAHQADTADSQAASSVSDPQALPITRRLVSVISSFYQLIASDLAANESVFATFLTKFRTTYNGNLSVIALACNELARIIEQLTPSQSNVSQESFIKMLRHEKLAFDLLLDDSL